MNPSPDLLVGTTQGLALTMSVLFLTYVGFIVVPFVRHRPAADGDPRGFGWHLLIPCRDEDTVIGETIGYVRRTFPLVHVWVIDDASYDDTAGVVAARAARDGGVHLVRRCLPEARTGKADALNAGYREMVAWLASYDALDEAEQTIICVVDADGRLTPEALRVCAGPTLFGDSGIGAVQVGVRMSNRDERVIDPRRGRAANFFGRTLVRMQDIEFRTAIAAIQLSRRGTGTVSMGGSGQFTRLSALAGIDDDGSGRPWHGAQPEDLDLGVHLLAAGYRTAFTMDTHVEQEGLPSLRRLLRRRTPWSRGTTQYLRCLGRVRRSGQVSTVGAARILHYLLQPCLRLFATVVYPVPWILLGHRLVTEPDLALAYFSDGPGWILFWIYGTLGLLPFLIWGPVYWRRCEPDTGALRALGWGVAYTAYSYAFYVTCWRAVPRIVRRRSGWPRIRRNAEPPRRVLAADR